MPPWGTLVVSAQIESLRPARAQRASGRQRAVLGFIRQLCVTGIDSHLLAPHLVAGVRELIGGDWGALCWPDKRDQLSDLYAENQEIYAVAPTYARHYGGTTLEREALGVDFPTAMRTGQGWQNLDLHRERLVRSAYFADLYRPMHAHHGLEVTACDGRRGWGSLLLYRGARCTPFSTDDQRTMSGLAALIAHALRAKPTHFDRLDSPASGQAGIIVADARGKIILTTDCGSSLLYQVLEDNDKPAHFDPFKLPCHLLPLLRAAHRLALGLPSKPPVLERMNRWGRFTFRAYAMRALDERPGMLIALHVHRLEPLSLRVLRNAWQLGLSARQREVCVHIVARRSYSEMARLMGVRTSTVIDHVRKLYTKLGVRDHQELLTALLSGDPR
jgi:DNA-binding CsgD family transcriptional regulator